MTASRFTKAFQLTALVLVFSVANVYVMAGPVKASTDPKETKSEAAMADRSSDKAAAATTLSAESQLLTPQAAAEKMPLTAGSKALFNRIFSKRGVEARLATGNTFLKAKSSFKDTFNAPGKRFATAPADSDDDNDESGKTGMWVAIGVVAAVLVIAVVALQHDRDITGVQGQ